MYMCHSLTVQYPIQRCGTAEGTNQHRTTRTSSTFDHTIFSNFISESKLDRRFTKLITETPGICALYARLGGDVRGMH